MGIKTVRFNNRQVLNDVGIVLIELKKIIKDRAEELEITYVFSTN